MDHILRGTVLPLVSSEILRGMASEEGLSQKMRLTLDRRKHRMRERNVNNTRRAKRSFLRYAAIFSIAAAGVATSLGAVIACSSNTTLPIKEPDSCKQQIIGTSVIASERLNPTECGDSRPVQLRIYQLKTDIRLQNASFDEIWKQDKETLKDDLIKVEEMTVYPDSRQEIKFERDDAALVVAFVALFRNHRGRSWYTTFELPPPAGRGTAVCRSAQAVIAPTPGG